MDEASIETARRTLGEIVDKARLAGEPTRITRQGKPAAVVVSSGWYARAAEAMRPGLVKDPGPAPDADPDYWPAAAGKDGGR